MQFCKCLAAVFLPCDRQQGHQKREVEGEEGGDQQWAEGSATTAKAERRGAERCAASEADQAELIRADSSRVSG